MLASVAVVVSVSRQTRRRFVLGCQGLWPGRQGTGLAGTRSALLRSEAIQVDPLNVVARSHDLALHGRVVDYRPEHLDQLLYSKREFFDYGGVVLIVAMDELPYWRLPMRRRRDDARWSSFASEHKDLLASVRRQVRDHGPVGTRDFAGVAKKGTFRSGKETSAALYYLWLTGELMTHSRRNFERLYGLRADIAPAEHNHAASKAAAEAYFARKALDYEGLPTGRTWAARYSNLIHRRIDRTEATKVLTAMVEARTVTPVEVEGSRDLHFAPTDRLTLLERVAAGKVPTRWRPKGPDTMQEAVLLAPLDIVSARGRAGVLFDFEYLWEVYKPAAKRRWGYYTMPVLHGDALVARLDPRFERDSRTLQIRGLWLEDDASARDDIFIDALAAGIFRLGRLVGADRVDLSAVTPRRLGTRLNGSISAH